MKGMLLVDLETGKASNVPVKPNYMIDHPPIDCSGMRSDEIAEIIMDMCHEDEISDRMVRINLKNVNRVAYRSIDQGKLNRLGGAAIYFKIRLDFCDEEDRIERPVDRRMLHVDFAGFLEERRSANLIPETIKDEVVSYGTVVMKMAVLARQKETTDAS